MTKCNHMIPIMENYGKGVDKAGDGICAQRGEEEQKGWVLMEKKSPVGLQLTHRCRGANGMLNDHAEASPSPATAEVTECFMGVAVLTPTDLLSLQNAERLPVPESASPSQHCRCKRAVCPQSRRRTAAGPCCRRSCSCRSPRLLGVQGHPVKALSQQSVTYQPQYSWFAMTTIQGRQIFTLGWCTEQPRGVLCSQKEECKGKKE